VLLQDEEARAAEAEVLGRAAGLAPAGALAADEQVTARARELKQAGLEGDMGQLRARAFLDLLLGADSRPGPDGADPAAEPAGGAVPGGFAGRVTLTVPLITTDPGDHRHENSGHDAGVKLRHLAQIRHATCTSPICRRPAAQADFEHNTPYEAGGRTCLCNAGPKCRHDHRLKQHPGWHVDQLPDGTFRWTTPAGRSYDTEPTSYPI